MRFLLKKNCIQFLGFICCLSLSFGMSAQAQTTSLFIDSSLTAKTVSAYGQASVVPSQSKFEGAVGTFDGSGDYLVVAPSPLDANQKVFTIEAWVYMSSIPANGWPIVSQSAIGSASEQQLFVSGSNGGAENKNKLRFSRGADATNPIDLIGSTTLPLNQWVHVALSCDGVTAKLFVNGNLDASTEFTSGWIATAQAFYVATTLNTNFPAKQSFAEGKMSDLRVTKGTARYTSSFIPGFTELINQSGSYDTNSENDSLLMAANGRNGSSFFNDTSPNPKRIMPYGDVKISNAQSRFGDASAYFDGNGDYLSTSYHDDFNLRNQNFTIEGWAYFTAYSGASLYGTILSKRFGGSDFDYVLYVNGTQKQLVFSYGTDSTARIDIGSGGNTVTLNSWYHFAVTREGSTIRLFLNGNLVGTSVMNGALRNRELFLDIGKSRSYGDSYFAGYLDDLRITKGVARYTANFTPIETPPSPIKTGDAQWLKVPLLLSANGAGGTKNFTNLAVSSKSFTASGDVSIATGQSKFGGASAYFDGNGDYLSTSYHDDFNLRNQNFTIEGWAYFTAYSGASLYGTILSKRFGGSDFDYVLYVNGTQKQLVFSYGTDSTERINIGSGENTVTLNSWYHFAITCEGSTIRLFLNGNLVGTSVMNGALRNRELSLDIGKSRSYGDSYFAGYLDDLRITKGAARYTANFTPIETQFEPARFLRDPYTSRVSLLLLSGATAADSVTPYVTTTSKKTNSNAALDSITVNFSEAIEPSSITSDQFTVTDAAQNIYPVTSITTVNSTSFELGFAPSLLGGTYNLKAWPYILNVTGLGLDQNNNGVGGEIADVFEQSIAVDFAAPSVIAPSVDSAGTDTGVSVSWPAYVMPVNGAEISKYSIYVSTSPFANISQATKVLDVVGTATVANVTGLLANTTYYVAVVAVDVNGRYISTVTPVVAKTQEVSEQSVSTTYNDAGQILKEDGPRTDVNDITTNTYNIQGLIATTTNALGHVTTYNSYDASGNLLSVTDPNGITTEFTYHERGWLLSSRVKHPTTASLDSLTIYTYDAVGQMLSTTLPNGAQIFYEYDGARRLTVVRNAANERIEYTLDAAGNRTQQVIKNAGGAITYSVSSTFDELSRVMKVIGNNGQQDQHQYDVNDNRTATIDGRTNTIQQTYDALNRVKKIIDPNLGETQFTYNSQDQIKTVTDARGNTTIYNYDGLGNLISQTSPDTGTTTFTYDAAGNRITSTDARGVVVNYSYDALNRLTSIEYPAAPSENITYNYDATANGNYSISRLTSILTSATRLDFEYNPQGLFTKKYVQAANTFVSTQYDYDTAGNLTGITYPSGREVIYLLDSAGRISSITTKATATASAQTLVNNIGYLPFGPAKSFNYGNGLTHSHTFDLDYRLTNIQVGGLLNRTYGYDPVNNITSIVNSLSNSNSQGFSYDALNRLITANGGYGNLAYSYDAVGNRLSETRNGASDTYQYESTSNRLTGITRASGNRNFTYDAAGNPIQRTGDDNSSQSFTFNKANRLSGVSVNGAGATTYLYNGLGQRVMKTLSATSKEIYHYDEAGHLITVTDQAGVTLRDYIYWGNQQIALVNNGTIYYIHNDHLNTPQVITNQSQQVVWMGYYEPFGKVASNANNSIEIFSRFPGQYLDSETGLYYNYFRDYDPSIGRYIESDPIGLQGGINTYLYVDGNPISYADFFGLQAGGAYPPALPGSRPGGFHPDRPGRPGKPFVIDPDGGKWTPHTEDIGHWPHWDGPNGETWPANANKPRPGQKNPRPGQSPTNPNDPDAEPWVPPERPAPGSSSPAACPDGSTCHQVIQATRNAAGAVILWATYWLCTAS